MTITYKLEPDDLRAFQRYALKHSPSIRRIRYLGSAFSVGFCLWLTLTADDHRITFRVLYFLTLMLVFWIFMRVWMFITTRVSQWRSYTSEKHRSSLCEHTVSLTDQALVEVTPFNEAKNLWSGIYQVVDTTDYIYIFLSLHLAHIIPKRAFPDSTQARQFYERAASLQSSAKTAP